MSKNVRPGIGITRRVLLVEIERRCNDPQCLTRTRIGLTKEDARLYCGFECEQCKQWTSDSLSERDVPDWWEELTITDMHTMRAQHTTESEEPGEIISRMSDDYRRIRKDEG